MVHYYTAVSRPSSPICSICIANYNGLAMLADCLESVFAQEKLDISDIEIVVHDDASTDDSVNWLRTHYPQIELLVSKSNVGFCISNNRMASHARGEYILLLNNDAALYPDALITLLSNAKKQNPSGISTLPQYDWESGVLVDRGCMLDPFYNPIPNLDLNRRNVAMAIGACLFLPRSLWLEMGGFPEWIESIGEDMYLCCQARLRGNPVQVTPSSGYRHRQGISFGGNRVVSNRLRTTYRRRALSERNKTYVLFVLTPTILMWPLLATHLIALIMEGLILSLIKRSTTSLSEIYWPVIPSLSRNRHLLRKHRQSEQGKRRVGISSYMATTLLHLRKVSMLWHHGVPDIKGRAD